MRHSIRKLGHRLIGTQVGKVWPAGLDFDICNPCVGSILDLRPDALVVHLLEVAGLKDATGNVPGCDDVAPGAPLGI